MLQNRPSDYTSFRAGSLVLSAKFKRRWISNKPGRYAETRRSIILLPAILRGYFLSAFSMAWAVHQFDFLSE